MNMGTKPDVLLAQCRYCVGAGCVTCKQTGQLARYKRTLRAVVDGGTIIFIERVGTFIGRTCKDVAQYEWSEARVSVSPEELKAVLVKLSNAVCYPTAEDIAMADKFGGEGAN